MAIQQKSTVNSANLNCIFLSSQLPAKKANNNVTSISVANEAYLVCCLNDDILYSKKYN